MRQRLMALKRLGAVYELIEEIHSIEARIATFDVDKAEAAIHIETSASIRSRKGEREAIEDEDHLGRSAMETQRDIALRRKRQLEPLLEQRQKIRDAARARHMASKLWRERMKILIEAESERITFLEDRRNQTATDDRFLAQKRDCRKEKNKKT